MFDTRPGPLTDPRHLDEFDRIFKHGKYAEKPDKEKEDKKEQACKK